ncbi:MAG: ZIP family metal transporter [Candidatus Nanohaloarchaea archaeon]
MDRLEKLGTTAAVAFAALTVLSLDSGLKVVAIGWTAFAAMAMGGLAAGRALESRRAMVWSYGLSGGAALASVLFFVMPQALSLSTELGVTGILFGFLSGLALHTLSHEISHHSKGMNTLWSVTIHSLFAGVVIGLIYQQMPSVSVLLGVAIVSHKLPAGYMIADRLRKDEKTFWKMLLLPASGLGLMALLSFNYPVMLSDAGKALFFGFSTGIFLHVALDFLPDPEPESHLRKLMCDKEDPFHDQLDDIRMDSIASTVTGAAIVTALALLL